MPAWPRLLLQSPKHQEFRTTLSGFDVTIHLPQPSGSWIIQTHNYAWPKTSNTSYTHTLTESKRGQSKVSETKDMIVSGPQSGASPNQSPYWSLATGNQHLGSIWPAAIPQLQAHPPWSFLSWSFILVPDASYFHSQNKRRGSSVGLA